MTTTPNPDGGRVAGQPTTRALVEEHLAAFNAHDRTRLLDGLATDVVWTTGTDTLRGVAALVDVFDDGLWAMRPSLTVVDLLVDGSRAAAQLLETLTVDGSQRRFMIASFVEVRAGRIARVTVYREGNADID